MPEPVRHAPYLPKVDGFVLETQDVNLRIVPVLDLGVAVGRLESRLRGSQGAGQNMTLLRKKTLLETRVTL